MKQLRWIAALWGVIGVIALLGFAVYRLTPFVLELTHERLEWWQWMAMSAWCAFMLYSEGYRAFQQQFSPRVVARAQYLCKQATTVCIVLAPLFCVGYFAAPRRRVITAYVLMIGIIMLIVLVHFVPQPWRGIIDVGVVAGLFYGIMTLVVYGIKAMRHPDRYITNPEVIHTT